MFRPGKLSACVLASLAGGLTPLAWRPAPSDPPAASQSLTEPARARVVAEDGFVRADLELQPNLEPVRSAIFLSYRNRGIGRVAIRNRGEALRGELQVRFDLPGRADLLPEPVVDLFDEIESGEVRDVAIRPRFAPAILEEPTTELRARIEVTHRPVGSSESRVIAARETLLVLVDRSSVTWDLPERLAALIDPASVAALVRQDLARRERVCPKESGRLSIVNLELAAVIFDTLRAQGLRYLKDAPESAAAALLEAPVDQVSLPTETLRDHAGDCDDLSVLLSSALESAGVPTALAYSDEHIIVLFDLGIGIEAAETAGLERASLLERSGRVWMPIEATALARASATLMRAWSDGRAQLEMLRSGAMRLFEIRKAWRDYPAIGGMTPRENVDGSIPHETERCSDGAAELALHLVTQVAARAETARQDAGSEGEADLRAARVWLEAGLPSEARALLRRSLERQPDVGTRLELARAILQHPGGRQDLDEARSALEVVLAEADPMDLALRGETLRQLAEAYRLLGNPVRAARMLADEAALLGRTADSESGLALVGGPLAASH